MEKRPYQPIDCNIYDVLLAAATLQQVVELRYQNPSTSSKDEVEQQVRGRILDVYTKAGEEFLQLSSGEIIRLDHLIAFDGEAILLACPR